MQIRPTAFTIGLIIHFSIALFCVYTEFGIDSIFLKKQLFLRIFEFQFFQNGESLGIAKNNIEGGEGIAYFPGLSFSSHEKCAFNFGAFPFVYSYPGYEPIDIPKSQYNGSFEVTSSLLQILNQCKLFDVLDDDYTDMYFRNLINQKIFYFLLKIGQNLY